MSWQNAVATAVTGLGYELVDAERGAGGVLRVYIDHPAEAGVERHITVDDCERVTRQLQHVLEVEGCDYQRLEVSSPGLDRPLKREADYVRFAGALVELTLKLPFKGRKKYRGELQPAEAGWRLVLSDASGTADRTLDFTLDEVREAHLVPVLDFKGRRASTPDAPGAGAGTPGGGEVDGGLIQ
jgi:ribosome maturation factor RimP